MDGLVGYKRLSGSVKWNILAGIGYELRQSTENIIDTGKNKEYAVLGSLTMYRNRILSANLKGAVEIPSAAGTISVAPDFEYYLSSAEYIFPKREMAFGFAEAGLNAGLRKSRKEWLFSAEVRFNHYEHFHSMITSDRTTAGLSLGIQRKVGQNTAVFLRPDFSFRAIDGFGHAGFLAAAIGLAF